MEPAHVLVIEDDDIVARTIERSLRGDEFRVTLTHSGVEGLKTARRRPPDLVILDIIMPGMDGYTVCREMRSDPLLVDIPILFLTAKIKDEDKIAGFNAGADDYLTKPFSVDELMARMRVAQRHAQLEPQAAVFTCGSLEVDLGRRLVLKNGEQVKLTPTEYALLRLLIQHAGRVLTHRQILKEVWGPASASETHYLRVYVAQLRQKIEHDPALPKIILTEPGVGYRLVIPE